MAGIAGASINVGSKFETTFAKASTLFGDVSVDTKGLQKDMLALSNSTGIAATELNQGLYSALSAGIPVTEDMAAATGFMEKSAKLAKAGFTDVDTAVSATAKTLNAYDMDVSEADKVQKILIQTQNKGITTVGELGASLSQVTPTAAAFGVSFENVGASLAGMTASGTGTAQATTQLNSLIAELGKNGTQASKNLQKAAEGTQYAGMSFTEMMGAGADLNDVLGMMDECASASGLSMVDMFSSIEAGRASLAILGSDFEGNMEAMATGADVVGDAYAVMADTFETKSDQAKESIKNLGITLYNDLLEGPAKNAMDVANEYIAQLSAGFEANGAEGLITVLGSILTDLTARAVEYAPRMIELAVSLIQSLVNGMQQNLPAITQGVVTIVTQLTTAFISMLPQLLEMGIQVLVQLAQGITQALPTLIPAVVDVMLQIVDVLISNMNLLIDASIELMIGLSIGLVEAIPILLERAPEILSKLCSALIEAAPKLLLASNAMMVVLADAVIKYLPKLIAKVPVIISELLDKFFSLVHKFMEVASRIIGNIKDKLISDWNMITSAASELTDKLKEKFLNAVKSFVDIGKNIVDGIWNGISAGWDWLTSKVADLASSLLDAAKSVLGIHSPSREFAYIGKMCVAGFDDGIDELMNADSLQKNINATLGSVKAGINWQMQESTGERAADAGSSIVNNFYDTQCTPDAIARKVYKTMTYGLAGVL